MNYTAYTVLFSKLIGTIEQEPKYQDVTFECTDGKTRTNSLLLRSMVEMYDDLGSLEDISTVKLPFSVSVANYFLDFVYNNKFPTGIDSLTELYAIVDYHSMCTDAIIDRIRSTMIMNKSLSDIVGYYREKKSIGMIDYNNLFSEDDIDVCITKSTEADIENLTDSDIELLCGRKHYRALYRRICRLSRQRLIGGSTINTTKIADILLPKVLKSCTADQIRDCLDVISREKFRKNKKKIARVVCMKSEMPLSHQARLLFQSYHPDEESDI